MKNARILYAPSLPKRIEDVKNKKHQLRNDLLDYLEENELQVPVRFQKQVKHLCHVLSIHCGTLMAIIMSSMIEALKYLIQWSERS